MDYQGSELEVFANASNWKAYWSARLTAFVNGRVAEVGAGIGANVTPLFNNSISEWTAVEPDADMAARIQASTAQPVSVITGTIRDLQGQYDTLLYIDVLEHIEDDRQELAAAADRLAPGGHLVVLAPAYQFLFSPFDQAIGHYRRYNMDSMKALTPAGTAVVHAEYLDSVGLLASIANRYLLKDDSPGPRQVSFWDRVMVPLSRVMDRLLFGKIGKTLIIIWRKDTHHE